MRVRKITPAQPDGSDPGGDMVFGHGAADYWLDDRRGVGQLVSSRLRLWRGQWFLSLSDGMPWATDVLGKYTDSLRDMAVQDRIYATPGVVEIVGYNSQLDRQPREWTVNATITTLYGQLEFTGPV